MKNFYQIEEARQIAKANQDEEEDGWEYVAVEVRVGVGVVEAYDERGEFVGYL